MAVLNLGVKIWAGQDGDLNNLKLRMEQYMSLKKHS